MNLNVEYLKKVYEKNTDFVVRELNSGKKDKIYIIFFESLTDSKNIFNFIIKPIRDYLNSHRKIKEVADLIEGPKIKSLEKIDDIFYYIENGFVAVVYKDEVYVSEIKAELDRGINSSDTEPNMYGPKDSFCENYQKNIGLINRRIKNKNFKIESVDRGVYTKSKLSLLYIDDKVNKNELEKIKTELNLFKDKETTDSYDLMKELEKNKVFPTIMKSEKPALVAKYLLKGYIVIMLDNTPFALIMDAKLKDFVNPSTTDKFVQILRWVCVFLNVLIPAIYIALVNFNPEAIPTSLLTSFSEQRSGVPFPSIVEAAGMLLICELLKEADIRFPSNYGSSASILGALVLGDAAVNAGIVSPIMIIIVALSFIAGLIFTETKLVSSLRVMRFSFLFIASFLGLYGLSISIIVCLAIISNVKMYEGSYL